MQAERVAELENDMSTARQVLGAQADMIANFETTMQERIRAAMAPIAGAAEDVQPTRACKSTTEEAGLQNHWDLMVL